jgi:hypothetical protein
MQYLHYKVSAGQYDSIIVSLNEETNFKLSRVFLLDTGNYYKYRLGKSCEFKQEMDGAPTVVLDPPYKSTWHIIIELNFPGEVRAVVGVRRKGA